MQQSTWLTPAEVARRFKPRWNGRPVSERTVWRWMLHGKRGIKLAYANFATGRRISLEAIAAFDKAINATGGGTQEVHYSLEARKVHARQTLVEQYGFRL